MGRYKSAAQKRRESEARRGTAKFVFVALVLAGLVALYFVTLAGRRTLDDATLCPSSPDSVTILLIDVTDPMNLAQRQDFINRLERVRSSIPRYGKIEIFKVDSAAEHLLTPVIVRCNPGTATDVNEWTGNPEAAAKRWERDFREPLDDAFSAITAASGATRSPILESIQSINLTEIRKSDADGKPKRLIIVSDLLQNTDRMSFYGHLPTPEQVVGSDAFRTLRTDLKGLDVELWMLQRPDSQQSQPRALSDLWEILLREEGANVMESYRVSG